MQRNQKVRDIAHQIWLERGGRDGSPEADWQEAERRVAESEKQRGNASVVEESNEREHAVYVQNLERSGRSEHKMAENYRGSQTGGNAGTMEHGMSDGVQDTANQVKEKASSLAGQVSDKVSNLSSQVSEKVGNLGSQVSETAHQYLDKGKDLVQNQPITSPRPEHREGVVARTLESQTARIPSDAWLWAAFGSIGLSLAFELSGREKTANFVGHWAPTFLIFGLYNKMVKLQGSDGQ